MQEVLEEGETKYAEASDLRDRMRLKAIKFLDIALKQAKKHFPNWANKILLFLCALGSEQGMVA
jgi:hypothetical protein